jgi:hypothetical protein
VLNYKQENKRRKEIRAAPQRQSERNTPQCKEIEHLKAIIAQKDQEIETLCALLDGRN